MGTSNKPSLEISVINKQEIKTELARGFVIALSLGAMLFYFVLFPAPFKETKTTEISGDETEATEIGDGGLRSSDIQFQDLSSCMNNYYSIISPINHGKRLDWSNFDQISYVVDSGSEIKIWSRDFLDCDDHGALMPQTLIGERQNNSIASSVIGNITGTNDYNEIVVSTQTTVEAYDMIGNEKWIWTPEGNETVDFAPPILADFHSSPEGLEVLATGHEGTNLHLYYLDGATGQLMSAAAHRVIPNVSSKNPISVSDLTLDYTPGVIVAADSTIYFLDNQGQLKSSFSLPSSSPHTPPMALPENNPQSGYVFLGYNEGSQTKVYGWYHHFYVGSMSYQLETLDETYPYWDVNHQDTYHWPITVNGNLDLDNNGTLAFANLTETVNPVTSIEQPDIVFITDDNKLHGYSHFGEHIFTSNIGETVNKNSQPVAFDYDNDGRDEIFVTTNTRIYVYESDGSIINNDVFPLLLEEHWGTETEFGGPLTIIYNGQHDWPIFSVPVDYANGSAAWQFTVWVLGEDYTQPSFTGPGGSIHNTNSYNFCRLSGHMTSIGDCSSYYGTTGANSFCSGGAYVSNCYLCGCPNCYDCPGLNNQCYYTCSNPNPPQGGCGGSPVMMKEFIHCSDLQGGGGE